MPPALHFCISPSQRNSLQAISTRSNPFALVPSFLSSFLLAFLPPFLPAFLPCSSGSSRREGSWRRTQAWEMLVGKKLSVPCLLILGVEWKQTGAIFIVHSVSRGSDPYPGHGFLLFRPHKVQESRLWYNSCEALLYHSCQTFVMWYKTTHSDVEILCPSHPFPLVCRWHWRKPSIFSLATSKYTAVHRGAFGTAPLSLRHRCAFGSGCLAQCDSGVLSTLRWASESMAQTLAETSWNEHLK